MQSNCKKRPPLASSPRYRRGLTLIELVVVLAILVALAGLVTPLISGLGTQTNASTNATVVDDVNRAVGAYFIRHEVMPDGWDSLLNDSGNLYGKLHENLTLISSPLLHVEELTAQQADSLTTVGIRTLADAAETGSPNVFASTMRDVLTGGKVATLISTTGSYSSNQFCLQHLEAADPANKYVVLGLGGMTTIRGASMRDVPLISSADPNANYARVLCVFMVPGTGSNAVTFPAKYVGCFLPDGTSQRMNLDSYNNSKVE